MDSREGEVVDLETVQNITCIINIPKEPKTRHFKVKNMKGFRYIKFCHDGKFKGSNNLGDPDSWEDLETLKTVEIND